MFDDELATVEESFRGLGAAREGVKERGEAADEDTLIRALEATERVRRAADALELAVIGQAVRWSDERAADGSYRRVRLGPGQVAEFAEESVGLAVRAGPYEAGTLCDLAARATTDLVELADLVAAGDIRARSVALVAKETEGLGPETVRAVIDHLLAPMRSRPDTIRIAELEDRELRKACRRIIERTEPEALRRTCEKNRREQLDVTFRAGPVGTSDLHATLPSEIAAAIKAAVDEAAARRRTEDSDLTAGAARAWGLADLVLRGVELTAHVRLGVPVITSAASRIGFAPVAGGEGSEQGSSVGDDLHGPTSRELRIVTGEGADMVDVLPEEWAGEAVSSQAPTTFGPSGPPGWVGGCEIPGVGYVPPDAVAAIMSHLETRVGRALLDARTGTLVETSNPRYVITDSMRDFVAARDQVCRMWGCNRSIRRDPGGHGADLDHATAWPEGASTPANVSGLCRHHHRLKHSPRWSHRLNLDGTTEWVSPTGVSAMTFPAQWVHTDDEWEEEPSSPPAEGAKELVARFAGAPPF